MKIKRKLKISHQKQQLLLIDMYGPRSTGVGIKKGLILCQKPKIEERAQKEAFERCFLFNITYNPFWPPDEKHGKLISKFITISENL